MRSRRSVWSDPTVQLLAREFFLPVAQSEGDLRRRPETAEGMLFQRITEQFPRERWSLDGKENPTRQCIAVIAPDGTLLDGFTLWQKPDYEDPQAVLGMLTNALNKWRDLPDERRRRGERIGRDIRDDWERAFPRGGLVLRVVTRDLPSENDSLTPEMQQELKSVQRLWWNMDYAWFRKEEVSQFLPETLEPGAGREVPRGVVERLAAYHLTDNVHCQDIEGYQPDEIEKARLIATVIETHGDVVRLRLEGESKTTPTKPRPKGFDARLLGYATYDRKAQVFRSFDLVAVGQRHGGGSRHGSARLPGLMGVAFTIAAPEERVPPLSDYWKEWRCGSDDGAR